MGLTISPLVEEEIPEFVRIELEAFRPHPRIPMLWTRGYTDDLYAFYESEKRESLLHDGQCRLVKAVDEDSGKMVAAAEWTFALDPAAASEPLAPDATPPSNWPVGGNWDMRRFFNLNLDKWKKEYLAGQAFIKLDILVTDPHFSKRGAGSQLLAWGMEQADKLGVSMCLEATPTGLSLYQRFGFEEKEVIKADMRQFGWDQPYDEEAAKRVWMIRRPRPAVHVSEEQRA